MTPSFIQCPSCSAEIREGSRFCESCGQPISSFSQMPTASGAAASPAATPRSGFTPGTVLADRYRIVGLLGRGGMGEVYRADDLKLGQPVALKFLPRALAWDPSRRERFFAEVRITRQLSHPNICRVYDIAEFEGQHFLSMEYIDGEDLASLIKRIGYLSNEKALEIARQLAAGLAAAHERGVLHRDLKPANIMIDGHGRVRITDFGLAVAVGDETESAAMRGTPAYMAPEQFEGKPASVRSDVYALGLILYEICCGRQAFTASTISEIREQKQRRTPKPPSEIREGVELIVERLIMRCLERDSQLRPASVSQLAMALPGGDPLAAAIAAGETPSPEMVAASRAREGFHPAVAVALLVFVIVGSLALAWTKDRTDVLQRTSVRPRDVLIERAQEVIRKVGYTDPPADSAFLFNYNAPFIQYLEDSDKTDSRWKRLDDFNPITFIYRQSPRPLLHLGTFAYPFIPGGVTPIDPALQFAGEVLVVLDGKGNLRELRAVPPTVKPTSEIVSTPDWSLLFSEAGLDFSGWRPVVPQARPPVFADQRAAWEGSLSVFGAMPVRIEAAAYRGKPVSFQFVDHSALGPPPLLPPSATLVPAIIALLFVTLMLTGIVFARRNVRLGRGDRRGAIKIVVFVEALIGLSWLLKEHHVATLAELILFVMFVGWALFCGALLWVLYMALEPFVRRRWPHVLVSWTRLLAGAWNDSLVGRDILAGCAGGIAIGVAGRAALVAPLLSGGAEHLALAPPEAITRTAAGISLLSVSCGIALFEALGMLFLLFVLRLITRNDWAAMVVFVLAWGLPPLLRDGPVGVTAFIVSAIFIFLLMRFGLLALATGYYVSSVFVLSPITLHTSAWYFDIGFACFLLVAAITLYGFRTSLGSGNLIGSSTRNMLARD